jgi:hypothetical protein
MDKEGKYVLAGFENIKNAAFSVESRNLKDKRFS